jgi:hypothetical protein
MFSRMCFVACVTVELLTGATASALAADDNASRDEIANALAQWTAEAIVRDTRRMRDSAGASYSAVQIRTRFSIRGQSVARARRKS